MPPYRSPALFAGVEPIEVMVELLAGIDEATAGTEFYNRICEAICRLTSMERAAIFMADVGRRRVRAVGAHGASFEQLALLRPTLTGTPIAQRALLEDRVVVVDERIEQAVPAEVAELLGITTLVCTPLSAAGRGYGVICADRGGGRFELSDGERHLLWTLGKTAALVTTARNATRQQERARRLSERLDLAREIHEQVLQRLFGVSLALSAASPLDPGERERCRSELQQAVGDLRRALERPLAPLRAYSASTLPAELERLAATPLPPTSVHWQPGLDLPEKLDQLAQAVLTEALRNTAKHAVPDLVQIRATGDEHTFSLEIRNDGVGSETARAGGMGLRLATVEALGHGGVLEYGPAGEGAWRVRLVVPFPEAPESDLP